MRRDVIAGCRNMAEVYRHVEREYHSLEEEVQRAVEADPASDAASAPSLHRK